MHLTNGSVRGPETDRAFREVGRRCWRPFQSRFAGVLRRLFEIVGCPSRETEEHACLPWMLGVRRLRETCPLAVV